MKQLFIFILLVVIGLFTFIALMIKFIIDIIKEHIK